MAHMGLLSRIYFNAVFGGLGGLLGWMLSAIFWDKNAPTERLNYQVMLSGAFIGGAIGYLLVGGDAIRDRSLLRFARLASYGLVLGALGGALGALAGDSVNHYLV